VASTAKTAPGQVNSATVSFADAALDGVERVEALMEAGEFDLIAVGRALLADPDWTDKVREGRLDERIPFEKALLASLY
jgi:2,4-dienoyl-CoA reductase-like NADH-dependent reductase (Old Yellow Enzyme family)